MAFTEAGEYQVSYAQGCTIKTNSTDGFKEALAVASESDIVFFIGGISQEIESEGTDRTSIDWTGQQLNLIQQLETVSKNLVVIVISGGQIDLTYVKGSKKTNAIIWIGYPGQNGGRGLYNVLTGRVSPSGRMPVTQYPADYVDQVSMFDMALRPSSKSPGRTYKFYTGEAVYPFGYGLSYTTFSYEWGPEMSTQAFEVYNIQKLIQAGTEALDIDAFKYQFVSYEVNVTNTGSVTSDVSVLCFANTSSSAALDGIQPFKELIGYGRLFALKPSESRILLFDISLKDISSVDSNGHRWIHPGTVNVFIGHDARIIRSLELVGESQMLRKWPQSPENQQKIAAY
jgi:beta-D-xylosidase 4